MAYAAAAMYGAAALDGLIWGFLPGDPKFALQPVLGALVLSATLLIAGPRLPRWGLALIGPLGVALNAYALATTPGVGDGALLYAMPVLWTTLFFGRRGAVAIIACVGAGHAIALLSLPAGSSYPGRWVDVMVSVCAICVVVLVLEHRNVLLLARLAGEARTDLLTGLLNRRGFDERASLELVRAKRDGRPIALAALDIDHFKHVNDEWGHGIGDQVIARVGRLLAAESREIDVVARLGGEEFVVLLPEADGAGVEAFTKRVRFALASADPSGLPMVRVSVGTLITGPSTDIEMMLRDADSALYEAKRSGRNRTVAFQGHGDLGQGSFPRTRDISLQTAPP
jgi:diguanylate cyclase (GGDEF)-like protein